MLALDLIDSHMKYYSRVLSTAILFLCRIKNFHTPPVDIKHRPRLTTDNQHCLSYTQPTKASNSKDLFASFKMSEMDTLSKYQCNFQEALELNGLTLSNGKTGIEPTMSLAEFQKYVVYTLSTIKYDLNFCVSTNQQINANKNILLENLNKKEVTSDDGFNDYDMNDIFPIESLEALQEFEFKLQRNKNNFKTIIIVRLLLIIL
ncbi:hypothetical protein AGLY_012364 [Aphis glycines]|uniref:Uncharacterized protein n=1 Tax=Aphis glycines TaxID=307491 RepID=A0A6G0TA84_APHGL|nr:hypothetical protein AGLY_012364 [Aphis glycines]